MNTRQLTATMCLIATSAALPIQVAAGMLVQPAPRDVAKDPVPKGMVDLRPKFKAGQVTKLRLTMESTGDAPNLQSLDLDRILDDPSSTPPPPKSTPGVKSPTKAPSKQPSKSPTPSDPAMRSWQEMILVFKVKDASTDPRRGDQPSHESTVVEVTFESIRAKSTTPDGTFEFDSTKPGPGKGNTPGGPSPTPTPPADPFADPLSAALRPLVGTTLTLTLDPNGNITNIDGGEAFTSLAGMSLTGGGGGGKLFQSIVTPVGSPGLVRTGEPWTTRDTIRTGLIGDFHMRSESRVASHRRGLAEVQVKGVIEPESAGGAGGLGGFQVKDSKYSGRYTWDTDRGMLELMSTEQSIQIDAGALGLLKHEQTVRVQRVP